MTDEGGLRGLDLFSGIGGLTRALDGYVIPVAYCEIDPYCRGILLSRQSKGEIPYAPIWDDIRMLKGADLPPVDIVYGGFPCQDISVAGRGAGLAGERSGLFFEIVRLAEEVEFKFIFLENVPAIRTRGLDIVIKELSRLRYDCRWGMLSASDVGANHKRERWFLLANSSCQQDWGLRISKLQPDPRTGRDMANTDGAILRVNLSGGTPPKFRTGASEGQATWWSSEPNVGRVAHGVPKRVDRLRALGNAVVPQQAREAFERLMGLNSAE